MQETGAGESNRQPIHRQELVLRRRDEHPPRTRTEQAKQSARPVAPSGACYLLRIVLRTAILPIATCAMIATRLSVWNTSVAHDWRSSVMEKRQPHTTPSCPFTVSFSGIAPQVPGLAILTPAVILQKKGTSASKSKAKSRCPPDPRQTDQREPSHEVGQVEPGAGSTALSNRHSHPTVDAPTNFGLGRAVRKVPILSAAERSRTEAATREAFSMKGIFEMTTGKPTSGGPFFEGNLPRRAKQAAKDRRTVSHVLTQ